MSTDVEFKSWEDVRANWLKRVLSMQEEEFRKSAPPDEQFEKSKRFIFRGQHTANWPLRSSFDRIMVEHGKGRQDYIDRRYDEFMSELAKARSEAGFGMGGNVSGAGQFNVEAAALAQHIGLPTRLLDWSKSPYVAAFFAFSEPGLHYGPHAAIWCMDLDRVMRESVIRKSDVFIHHGQVRGNIRQAAQNGVFTINRTAEMDLEKVFLRTSQFMKRDPRTEVLFKFVIPRSCRNDVIEDLELMRINHLSLFPDEDGVIRYMRWRLLDKAFSGPNTEYINRTNHS